jgi:hypothetical protein
LYIYFIAAVGAKESKEMTDINDQTILCPRCNKSITVDAQLQVHEQHLKSLQARQLFMLLMQVLGVTKPRVEMFKENSHLCTQRGDLFFVYQVSTAGSNR